MTVSWPEPNAKGELNVTRMSVVLEEKVSSTHLVLNKSSGKKGTSSRITSWNINTQEEHFQCFIFHDVDLLPEYDGNPYTCPEDGKPRQMAFSVNSWNYMSVIIIA